MPDYKLSRSMRTFVEECLCFQPVGQGIAAKREAYLKMAASFTPPAPRNLAQFDEASVDMPPLRFYRPEVAYHVQTWPTLLYIHGGGWALGNLDSHDFICRTLALSLGIQIVAVDYRLAPEYPYPAALKDVMAAWRHLCQRKDVNTQQMVVAGDSGGGTLAAALCLMLQGDSISMPQGQVLIYPFLGPGGTKAYKEHSHAPLLSVDDIQSYLQAYLPQGNKSDPLAFPLLANDVSHLPSTFIAVAQIDPLRDDGILYAQRLEATGVTVNLMEIEGWLHGGLRALGSPETKTVMNAIISWLKRCLDTRNTDLFN